MASKYLKPWPKFCMSTYSVITDRDSPLRNYRNEIDPSTIQSEIPV